MKVRIHELEPAEDLKLLETNINSALAGKARVKLFRDRMGKLGYSLHGIDLASGKQTLLDLHALITRALGWKKGRPRGEPSRQIKLRIPESAYRALARRAATRSISPSRLAGEFVLKQLH